MKREAVHRFVRKKLYILLFFYMYTCTSLLLSVT
jgi:hypothetical protein